jgi:ER-bound oxygenase mpaB/B'/Rubber oxygenase, catalytic domain
MVPTRYSNLTGARARFGHRADRLGQFFDRVDPLADEVVAAIEATPGGWHLFDEASRIGIDRVPAAPAAFRAFFDHVERVPMWVDWETVDRGGETLLRAGPLGGIVLALKSLVLGYASPAGNKPLVFSGRLQEQAARRLNETSRFVQATISPGSMRPHAEGWRITLKVRLVHAHVRRMILKSGRWNAEAWGAPINQHDQAGTALLFSVIVLQGLRQLGMRIAWRDAEAYVHLWRWSGWLMGVDPELLPATEAEGVRLGEVIEATMGEPDEDSRRLTRALLESPLQTAKTRFEIANARRLMRFSAGMCRELLGGELADALAVPRTPWRFMVPFARRLVSSVELVRKTVPFGDVPAVWAGRRYWDRVVELGLAGAMADFALPQSLARAA